MSEAGPIAVDLGERFDEIAKLLATGQSRRAVLKLSGGLLGGGLFGLIPSRVQAATAPAVPTCEQICERFGNPIAVQECLICCRNSQPFNGCGPGSFFDPRTCTCSATCGTGTGACGHECCPDGGRCCHLNAAPSVQFCLPPGASLSPAQQSYVTCSCVNTVSCGAGVSMTCCADGQDCCAGICTSVSSDDNNCGGCGVGCTAGHICVSGHCVCPAPLTDCAGVCIDISANPADCGACGNACPTGAACVGGICTCPAGQVACGGACVSTTCPDGEQLDTASCTCQCPSGQTFCPPGHCVNTQADSSNCGACGNVCPSGATCQAGQCTCASGQVLCGGACVSTTCPGGETFNLTSCTCQCPSGLSFCSGNCVDTSMSTANCGSCGNICPTGATCVGGACQCPPGQSACGTMCVNTNTDASNCGTCGHACPTGQSCVNGACQQQITFCAPNCQSPPNVCCTSRDGTYNACISPADAPYCCAGGSFAQVCSPPGTCCNNGSTSICCSCTDPTGQTSVPCMCCPLPDPSYPSQCCTPGSLCCSSSPTAPRKGTVCCNPTFQTCSQDALGNAVCV